MLCDQEPCSSGTQGCDYRCVASSLKGCLKGLHCIQHRVSTWPLSANFKRSTPKSFTHWLFNISLINFKFCQNYFIGLLFFFLVFSFLVCLSCLFVCLFFYSQPNQSLSTVWLLPGWHWHLNVNNLTCPGGSFVVYVTPLNSLQQD